MIRSCRRDQRMLRDYNSQGVVSVGSMRSVGIRELKRRLSSYLAAVKSGDEVLVTDRGVPVARIIREPRQAPSAAQALAQLVADGAVTLPTQELPASGAAVRVHGRPVSAIVSEGRR